MLKHSLKGEKIGILIAKMVDDNNSLILRYIQGNEFHKVLWYESTDW